jgi:hypothetical protein
MTRSFITLPLRRILLDVQIKEDETLTGFAIWETSNVFRIIFDKSEGKRHHEDLNVDRRIMLNYR